MKDVFDDAVKSIGGFFFTAASGALLQQMTQKWTLRTLTNPIPAVFTNLMQHSLTEC